MAVGTFEADALPGNMAGRTLHLQVGALQSNGMETYWQFALFETGQVVAGLAIIVKMWLLGRLMACHTTDRPFLSLALVHRVAGSALDSGVHSYQLLTMLKPAQIDRLETRRGMTAITTGSVMRW